MKPDLTIETIPLVYSDYIELLHKQDPDLAQELAGFDGMEQVLHWMERRKLVQPAPDLICQDEFSYDFLLQLEPGGRWLSFAVS
jgi:hypothetical protein